MIVPYNDVLAQPERAFLLYHGNLSVAENEKLLPGYTKSIQRTQPAVVVAGKKPGAR